MKSSGLPFFYWCEDVTGPLPHGSVRDVAILADNGTVQDRQGIVVVLSAAPANRTARWGAVWAAPLWESLTGPYRFRISVGGRTIESAAFMVGGRARPPTARGDPSADSHPTEYSY